jgi:predicted nucleic acid-binding protein
MLDCVIASVAHRHRATLLVADIDLSRVAGVVGIDLDEATVTG